MAFPVVEFLFKNIGINTGLKRIMMNAKGFFFFQFNTRDGLDDVLEGGPWMIRNSPIILKEWTMKTSLHKEELTSIPVWVKFHDVPIQNFEEEGISLIATYIGKPIMLDSFTSSMCKDIGEEEFRRVTLIEIAWIRDFQGEHYGCVLILMVQGFLKEIIISVMILMMAFQQVRNRKRNSKGNTKGKQAIPRGVPMSKGFQVGKEFAFNPKATVLDSNGGSKSAAVILSLFIFSSLLKSFNLDTHSNVSKPGPSITTNDRHSAAHLNDGGKKSIVIDSNSNLNTSIPTSNPYDALKSLNEDDDSEEEDVENIFDESVNLFTSQTGASTPADIEWKWTSSGGLCTKGTRIILGWNDDNVDIMIMAQTNQVMHCQINTRGDNRTIFCSFIYADNYYVDRRALWNNLAAHGSFMQDKPWVLLGDFNAALNLEDHSCGGYEPNISMREFKECVLTNLKIMSNVPFIDEFPGSFAIFQPFRDVVANGWNLNINGCAMFRLVKRLKGLKSPLRKLLYDQGNLHARVTQIRGELDEGYRRRSDLKSTHFLGVEGSVTPLDNHDLFSRVLDVQKAAHMVRNVSDAEIKSALFSMSDDKRLREMMVLLLAFFKKIIANRIKGDLGDLVSINQSAFVPVGEISDNILLTQELMRNYHRNWGHPDVLSKSILIGFGFHPTKIEWIMVCVSTTSYSVCINGNLHGWFNVHEVSGLVPSIPKSTAFFCNVPIALKSSILNLMPFAEGTLPVRYLGVPLISSRLLYRDCKVLVEKLESSSVFISDFRYMLMRGFLWCQGEMKKGKAKVAWDSVCLPLKEGGLGIRRLEEFNTALMVSHIWSILNARDSLWVQWIYDYKLQATTPIESNKPLVKDEDEYRSMIGSLMYLTASRLDIMFVVCACARFQVTPKASHLHAVKLIFRYLKHQPKLGLWYPRDSPVELEAFSDSDYAGASLDRKSTTGGCQFLGRRLISWQCKKHTIVANFTTEAEYVAAAHCCVQNPIYHSRTKHIEIRHHFIRGCYEKRFIDVLKIHTDSNVADLLTKGFDVTRISMDLRMDRCSAGRFYSYMVFNSGSLYVNTGSLYVNSGRLY
ncbi:putative reverse transcriptase domain-containing protein [Tanacetum coccineum]